MFRVSVRVFVASLLAIALEGCGGSSSETPFPLEPNLAMFDAGASAEAVPHAVFKGRPIKKKSKNDDLGDDGSDDEAPPAPAPEPSRRSHPLFR